MIHQSLTLVRDRLNAHFRALYAVPEDLVALSPLCDSDGKPAAEARNRLAMFLTNIARDPVTRGARVPLAAGVGMAPPLHLDIHFMLASGHDAETYGEGLKLISSALQFFQTTPMLTPTNVPEIPSGLSQLSVEIANLNLEEVGQLWGNLGGQYVPSVMFKMRSVIIDAGAIDAVVPLIRAPEGASRPAEAS